MKEKVIVVPNLDPAKVLRKTMAARDMADTNIGVVWEDKIRSLTELDSTSERDLRAFAIQQILIDEINLRNRVSHKAEQPNDSFRAELEAMPSELLAWALAKVTSLSVESDWASRSFKDAKIADEVYLLPLEMAMLRNVKILRS